MPSDHTRVQAALGTHQLARRMIDNELDCRAVLVLRQDTAGGVTP